MEEKQIATKKHNQPSSGTFRRLFVARTITGTSGPVKRMQSTSSSSQNVRI
jgi:hypothetical protein